MPKSLPNTPPKSVYFISRLERDNRGFIPLIATENESGYSRTDWRWNVEFKEAQEMCDSKNQAMGISKKLAMIIVCSTFKEIPKDAQTDPNFWECDCDENYIHKKSRESGCGICGARFTRMSPDAKVSEIPFGMTLKGGA